MNKKLLVGAGAGVAAIAAISAAKIKSAESLPKTSVWEKMRDGMEEMPEDFPLRVMLNGIEAIRVNSDRIVELLEQRDSPKLAMSESELIRTS